MALMRRGCVQMMFTRAPSPRAIASSRMNWGTCEGGMFESARLFHPTPLKIATDKRPSVNGLSPDSQRNCPWSQPLPERQAQPAEAIIQTPDSEDEFLIVARSVALHHASRDGFLNGACARAKVHAPARCLQACSSPGVVTLSMRSKSMIKTTRCPSTTVFDGLLVCGNQHHDTPVDDCSQCCHRSFVETTLWSLSKPSRTQS